MDYKDTKEITDTFMGRTIVSVANDTMTLDNGAVLTVIPNYGCGGCPSGEYSLDALNHVENVITSVKLDDTYVKTEDYSEKRIYSIFVYTGGSKNKKGKKNILLQVSGDDGNGYYGSGYEIIVK
jgi:hypothetical protein